MRIKYSPATTVHTISTFSVHKRLVCVVVLCCATNPFCHFAVAVANLNFRAFASATALSDFTAQFKRDVVDKLDMPSPKSSPKTRKDPSPPPADLPRRVPPPSQPYHDYDFEEDLRRPRAPPVGGADLDPLGRGIGGNIMDPRDLFGRPGRYGGGFGGGNMFPPPGGGRLPPGAVPPGARFDPFGPPLPHGPRPDRYRGPPPPGPGAGPNPDHMRPPDGYDDMFM